MRLVDNWRSWHRWYSNQSTLLAITIQGVWAGIDADQRAALPKNFVLYLTIAVLVLGFFGRFIDQTKKKEPPCSDSSPNT